MCPTPRRGSVNGDEENRPPDNRNGPPTNRIPLNADSLREYIIHGVRTSNNPETVERFLDILGQVVTLEGSPFMAIIVSDGIPAMMSVISQQGSEHPQLILEALRVFANMLFHCNCPDATGQYHSALIAAGAIDICIHHIHCDESTVDVANLCCQILIALAHREAFLESLSQQKAVVKATIDAMRRFPDAAKFHRNAERLLSTFVGDEAKETIAHEVVTYGGIETIMETMQRHSSDSAVQQNGIAALCHCANAENIGVAVHQKGAVDVVMTSLREHPSNFAIQYNGCNFINALASIRDNATIPATLITNGSHCHLIGLMRHEELSRNPRLMSRLVVALLELSSHSNALEPLHDEGIIPLVIQTMSNHKDIIEVQVNALEVLWNFSAHRDVVESESLYDAGTIPHVIETMSNYKDVEEVQANALHVLSGLVNRPVLLEPLYYAGIAPLVIETMSNHKDKELVQAHALGVLWNFVGYNNVCRATVSEEFDGVTAICEAMDNHRRSFSVQYEAAGALFHLSDTPNNQIRETLLLSNAITALWSAYQDAEFGSREIVFQEKVCGALENLGVMERPIIGNDYVFFNAIGNPPFDVRNLLGKDLIAETAPGWFRHMGLPLVKPSWIENKDDQEFLHLSKSPKIDQQVCLRVALPYGGRGFLVGRVAEICAIPSDGELEQQPTGSNSSDKDMKVSSFHKQSLDRFGVVNGQHVRAKVSLETSTARNDNLRYHPLPTFFRGESTKYTVTIRAFIETCADDDEGLCCHWKVVRIDEEESEN